MTTAPAVELTERLRAIGCVFAEEEARLILQTLGDDPAAVHAAVAARAEGVPLEHILRRCRFRGLDLVIGPGVFVPRHRTELLLDACTVRPAPRHVLDLGCGSGALAAALTRVFPSAQVHGAETDSVAVAVATVNGARYGFSVHHGDWFEALPAGLRGKVDIALGYLPHVPTRALSGIHPDLRAHEPEVSVHGGPDGLDPLRAVLAQLPRWIAPGGVCLVLLAQEQAGPALLLWPGAGTVAQDDGDVVVAFNAHD